MKVLVAGIGNIFLSDDGFGVEVANRLTGQLVAPGVQVADFGIRGVHLAYELLNGYDALVLVDALPMGEEPGTVAVIEPDACAPVDPDGGAPVMDAHSMSPAVVLASLAGLGGEVGRVVIVGCQPESVEEGIGLSSPVAAAVDQAMAAVHEVVGELLAAPTVGSSISSATLTENPEREESHP